MKSKQYIQSEPPNYLITHQLGPSTLLLESWVFVFRELVIRTVARTCVCVGELTPVYSYNLGIFCTLKLSAYENVKIWRGKKRKKIQQKTIINISRPGLQFICFPVQNMPDFFSGTCVSLATSLCHSSGFCIAFCAVLALNYQAVQGKACTLLQRKSIYHFSESHVEIIFRLFSLRTKSNRKQIKILIFILHFFFLKCAFICIWLCTVPFCCLQASWARQAVQGWGAAPQNGQQPGHPGDEAEDGEGAWKCKTGAVGGECAKRGDQAQALQF